MINDMYLEHHGIKGMKWGVRRFQREDGTRTSAGKRRYRTTKRQLREMSDAELNSRVQRLQREKQLRELEREMGQNAVTKVLTASGKAAATTVATAAMVYAVKKAISGGGTMSGLYDGNQVVDEMFSKKKK